MRHEDTLDDMACTKKPTCAEIRKALDEYRNSEEAIDGPLFARVGGRIRQQGYVGPDDLYIMGSEACTRCVAGEQAGGNGDH